jgi:hypothetical protein
MQHNAFEWIMDLHFLQRQGAAMREIRVRGQARMKSIGTTRQAAQEFGFVKDDGQPNVRAFLAWAKAKGIKPEHGETHHLWWNFLQIQNAFDKVNNVQPHSVNHDSIILGRLAHGKGAREIPAHS